MSLNKHQYYFLLFFLFFNNFVSLAAEPPTIDKTYDDRIQTVLLYPEQESPQDMIEYPVVHISQEVPLVLHFDHMEEDAPAYYIGKIFHCNADWTISPFKPIQYLEEYNEFYIRPLSGSGTTRTFYIHYEFALPPVTLTGNYILAVYDAEKTDQLIMVKRFSVYDNNIVIDINEQQMLSNMSSVQQINFSISYGDFDVLDPTGNLKVFVRQNGRTDKTTDQLKPTFFNPSQMRLDFNFLNKENAFEGGNEYRKFDIRSAQFNGFNVSSVDRTQEFVTVNLNKEEPRRFNTYIGEEDINGQFVIDSYEFGEGHTEADYVFVYFILDGKIKIKHPVYIFGALTEWQLKDEFRMRYDEENKIYYCRPFIKQGYYNYSFVVDNAGKIDEVYLEGSHHQTENIYEILVYYRIPGHLEDLLVGYKQYHYNPKR